MPKKFLLLVPGVDEFMSANDYDVVVFKLLVYYNPENGTVITVHKTHSKLIRKLKCSNGTDKP